MLGAFGKRREEERRQSHQITGRESCYIYLEMLVWTGPFTLFSLWIGFVKCSPVLTLMAGLSGMQLKLVAQYPPKEVSAMHGKHYLEPASANLAWTGVVFFHHTTCT